MICMCVVAIRPVTASVWPPVHWLQGISDPNDSLPVQEVQLQQERVEVVHSIHFFCIATWVFNNFANVLY